MKILKMKKFFCFQTH